MTSPSVLLLQVRGVDNEMAMLQERVCFQELSGLSSPSLASFNLVTEGRISWDDVDPHDVLLIGGAGSHTVTRQYDFTASLAEVVRRWVREGRPFLGSCWGHQFLAWALGGQVVTDDARGEVGTFDVHLTAEGRRDPLLAGMPDSFPVHLGHHDVVSELPPGMVELAYSDLGSNQVIRCAGLPVYGTQFHCEMTASRMAERLRMYSDEYLEGDDDQDRIADILRPTPEAEGLLCRFLQLVSEDAGRHAGRRPVVS